MTRNYLNRLKSYQISCQKKSEHEKKLGVQSWNLEHLTHLEMRVKSWKRSARIRALFV